MNKMFDALVNEVSDDTLAKIAMATVGGVITTVAAKKLYKKYKEMQLLKKYGSQEDEDKHQNLQAELSGALPNLIDAHTARYLVDDKK